jgi:hypothetical protein
MGQEARCALRIGKNVSRGTALLESTEIIFRGDSRLVIPFREMKAVQAINGELRFKFSGGLARFDLGPQAEKWAHKILHPLSLLDKLGVKPGMLVSVLGIGEKSFEPQLKKRGARILKAKPQENSDFIFFGAEITSDLKQIPVLVKFLKPAGALWVVYPKGRKEITEVGVISAGRAADLKDVKVCSFSATHTALKFVIPLARRG